MYWLLLLSLTFPPLKILANNKPLFTINITKMLSLSFAPVSVVFRWKFSLLTSDGLKQGHFYLMVAIYLFKGELTCTVLSIVCCIFNGPLLSAGKMGKSCQGEVTSTLWKANKTRNSRQSKFIWKFDPEGSEWKHPFPVIPGSRIRVAI